MANRRLYKRLGEFDFVFGFLYFDKAAMPESLILFMESLGSSRTGYYMIAASVSGDLVAEPVDSDEWWPEVGCPENIYGDEPDGD